MEMVNHRIYVSSGCKSCKFLNWTGDEEVAFCSYDSLISMPEIPVKDIDWFHPDCPLEQVIRVIGVLGGE